MCAPAGAAGVPPRKGGGVATAGPTVDPTKGPGSLDPSANKPVATAQSSFNQNDSSTWTPADWETHYRGQGLNDAQIGEINRRSSGQGVTFDDIYARNGWTAPDPSRTPVPTSQPNYGNAPAPAAAPAPPVAAPAPAQTPAPVSQPYGGPGTNSATPQAPANLPSPMGMLPDGTVGHVPTPKMATGVPPIESAPLPRVPSYGAPSAGQSVGNAYRVDPEYNPGSSTNNVTEALMRRYRRSGWY
jgi:hypothetical protein